MTMTSGRTSFAAAQIAPTTSVAASRPSVFCAPVRPPAVTPTMAPTTSAPASAMRRPSSDVNAQPTVKTSRWCARAISSTSREKPMPAASSSAAKAGP